MDKFFVEYWDKNAKILEAHLLRELTICDKEDYSRLEEILSYRHLFEKILELVILDEYNKPVYNIKKITEIDDGDYQGTIIFVAPEDGYEPDPFEYAMTYVFYGSCSGCDTMEMLISVVDAWDEQRVVDELMMLALHMVQRMKKPWSIE